MSQAGAAHLYATHQEHPLHLQSLQWWCANSLLHQRSQLARSQKKSKRSTTAGVVPPRLTAGLLPPPLLLLLLWLWMWMLLLL